MEDDDGICYRCGSRVIAYDMNKCMVLGQELNLCSECSEVLDSDYNFNFN